MPVLSLRLRLWVSRIFFTTAGTGSELILRFLRTMVLSRLLLPAEFGVAVAITLLIFASELVSDIGIQRFILNKLTEDDRALATAHALQIRRAFVMAIGIVLCASPMASLFGVPQFKSSFMLVAIITLIRGFNHLGTKQAQRDYNYRLEAISISASEAVGLAAAIVAGYLLRDHRAILVAFGVEAGIYVIMTQRLALSPYSLRMDPVITREALTYGLPLIANGVALAVMSQTDRMLVGHYLGLEALATYAVVLNIAVVPLSSINRIVGSVALPALVRDREAPGRLEAGYLLTVWGFALVGFLYACGISLVLDVAVPLLFGKAYTVADLVRLLVSLIVFARVWRWSPTQLLLTVGRTKQLALANMITGFGLVIGTCILMIHRDMSSILAGLLIGEIASTAVFYYATLEMMPSAYRSIKKSAILGAFGAAMIASGLLLFPEPSWTNRLKFAVLLGSPAALLTWGLLIRWKHRESIIARGRDHTVEFGRAETAQ